MTEAQQVSWPWWMAPARLIGRVRPGLAAAAQSDAIALERLPRLLGTVAVPLTVIAIAAGFAALHAVSGPRTDPPVHLEWLNLSMYNIYTEVPLFIFTACIIGALSPAAAVLFVLSFGAFDLIAAATHPEELRFWALRPFPIAGRLIAYWLLWLLAVEIPVMGRMMAVSVRGLAGSRIAVAGVSGLLVGTFTWLWTLAAPVLLRPVYLWSDIGGPYAELGLQLEKGGLVFALIAGVAAGAVAMLVGPAGIMRIRQWPAAKEVGAPTLRGRLIAVVRRLVVAGLLTIGLGGLITTGLDAVFLFVAFAGAGPLAQWLGARIPIAGLVQRIPAPALIALAILLVFGVALLTVGVPALASISEFFPLIAITGVGLFIVELILAPGPARERPPRSIAHAGAIGVGVGLVVVALDFVAPQPALADNYISLKDIYATVTAIAVTVAALVFMVVAATGKWVDIVRERARDVAAQAPYRSDPPGPPPPPPPPEEAPDPFESFGIGPARRLGGSPAPKSKGAPPKGKGTGGPGPQRGKGPEQ
jgi:hypothetical protein